ncbi:TPA: ATP-dependent protease, partial [Legionella pneumophila]|nr:ATP-dependent protease [Legionella pneumophila]
HLEKQSPAIREKVTKMHEIQMARQDSLNANLNSKTCEMVCELGSEEQLFLREVMSKLKLSARGYHRLLKVSRTIADMSECNKVMLNHLQQALSYKQILHLPK